MVVLSNENTLCELFLVQLQTSALKLDSKNYTRHKNMHKKYHSSPIWHFGNAALSLIVNIGSDRINYYEDIVQKLSFPTVRLYATCFTSNVIFRAGIPSQTCLSFWSHIPENMYRYFCDLTTAIGACSRT